MTIDTTQIENLSFVGSDNKKYAEMLIRNHGAKQAVRASSIFLFIKKRLLINYISSIFIFISCQNVNAIEIGAEEFEALYGFAQSASSAAAKIDQRKTIFKSHPILKNIRALDGIFDAIDKNPIVTGLNKVNKAVIAVDAAEQFVEYVLGNDQSSTAYLDAVVELIALEPTGVIGYIAKKDYEIIKELDQTMDDIRESESSTDAVFEKMADNVFGEKIFNSIALSIDTKNIKNTNDVNDLFSTVFERYSNYLNSTKTLIKQQIEYLRSQINSSITCVFLCEARNNELLSRIRYMETLLNRVNTYIDKDRSLEIWTAISRKLILDTEGDLSLIVEKVKAVESVAKEIGTSVDTEVIVGVNPSKDLTDEIATDTPERPTPPDSDDSSYLAMLSGEVVRGSLFYHGGLDFSPPVLTGRNVIETGNGNVTVNVTSSSYGSFGGTHGGSDYDYTAWGSWGNDGLPFDSSVGRRGHWVIARATTPEELDRRTGRAVFRGDMRGIAFSGDVIAGDIDLNVDFDRSSLSGGFSLRTASAGAWVTGVVPTINIHDGSTSFFTNDVAITGGGGGNLYGVFTGPTAQEMAGAWAIWNVPDSIGGADGVFRAKE